MLDKTGFVRLAQPEDAVDILNLLKMQHDESGVFPWDTELVVNTINRLMLDRSAGVVGVIDGPNQVVATVGLSMTQGAWYTTDTTLYELWAFVHPEHRRSTHAKNLISFAKQCADRVSKEWGKPLSYFSVVRMSDETERKQRLYARQTEAKGAFSIYIHNPVVV